MIAYGSRRHLQLARTLAAGALVALSGCSEPDANLRQGYIEGDFVYVSSPHSGQLAELSVRRGVAVKAGDPLFALENAPEKAARDEVARRRAQAAANLQDARKGRRPSELEALKAQLAQAEAALELSRRELARQEQLSRVAGASTAQALDRARSTRDHDRARVAQLQAELRTARLGSRADQVQAAQANLLALDAALARAEWDLDQKAQRAPVAGVVFDTLYRVGEWVPAGRPIVSLLPPENVKLRVFVPQTWLASIHVGDALAVSVDGMKEALTGKVSFISPRAEFTPPVIYSRENRAKLVYLVEALFDPAVAARLHPGQPVDVRFRLER